MAVPGRIVPAGDDQSETGARRPDPAVGGAALSEDARAVASGLRRASVSPTLVGSIAFLLDGVALALGFWFAGYASAGEGFDPLRAAGVSLALGFALASLAWVRGAYRLPRLRRFWAGAGHMLVMAAAAVLLAGLAPHTVLLVAIFVLPQRALGAMLAGAAEDFGLTERRAIVIGGGERGSRVMTGLAAAGADIRVYGIFDDRDDGRAPPVVCGVPKLGTIADLVAFVRAAEIDMLIVALPLSADRRISEVLKAVEVLPVDVRLSDFSDDPSFSRRRSNARRDGLIALISRPLRQRERLIKRALDLGGASAAILLLSPVLLVTALAIRLETPGPVLFRQPRHGYNHRSVDVWKFRSMHAADCDPAARRIVTRDDPRVTRVGRFIRRWSIDELPQLFNVLKGELSLVGPRPHALNAVSSQQVSFEALVDGYAARHRVRPGMTGWAQVNGWRGEIDGAEGLLRRVEFDLYYIENWSIWLDLRVLALTPFRLLDSRGAY